MAMSSMADAEAYAMQNKQFVNWLAIRSRQAGIACVQINAHLCPFVSNPF